MRRTGKRIYRRFWISNQIFDSSFRSRDMERSLDTTFGIFGQNRNFVDEYLKNQNFFWHAVFAGCSEMISSTFWTSFIEILNILFEKKSKNPSKMDIFGLYGWSRFFLQNRASSVCCHYCPTTSCQISERSYDRWSRKAPDVKDGRTDERTDGHGSLYRTNLQSRWVQYAKLKKACQ